MIKSDLKLARNRLGLTAKEMAEKLGVPRRTYETWEYRGKIPSSAKVAVRLIEENRRLLSLVQSYKAFF